MRTKNNLRYTDQNNQGEEKMTNKNRMKIFICTCLTTAMLLAAAPAFAESVTCLCVGITGQSAYCGNTIGGNHLKKINEPSAVTLKKMLHESAMATFNIQGWALDDSTGWLCWKGCLK
jgi:hypothetical protein